MGDDGSEVRLGDNRIDWLNGEQSIERLGGFNRRMITLHPSLLGTRSTVWGEVQALPLPNLDPHRQQKPLTWLPRRSSTFSKCS